MQWRQRLLMLFLTAGITAVSLESPAQDIGATWLERTPAWASAVVAGDAETGPWQSARPTSFEDAYSQLDARLSALEAANSVGDAKPGWIDASSEKFTVEVGGRIEADYVTFAHQDAASRAAYGNIPNYFEFRRLRLYASGNGYGIYDYRLQLEFEPEQTFTVRNADGTDSTTIRTAAVAIRDIWIGIDEIPVLGYVRFGQYFEPFGLEQLTSPWHVSFLERSLPVVFARARQVGIEAHNHTAGESLMWSYGVFFPAIDPITKEYVADRQGTDIAVRAVWTPWCLMEGRYLLHLGAGFVYNDDEDDWIRFFTRPETHESTIFVDTGDFAAASTRRVNAEAAWVRGPLSLQGEYFVVSTDGIDATPDMTFHGAYAYASYFLTGENRLYNRTEGTFSRVEPNTNFWLLRTPAGYDLGWGAWEVLFRWSFVDLDGAGLTSTRRGELHDTTLGLNWYWNPRTRYMLNWIHAYNDIAAVGRNDTDVISMRLEIDF
jgi:phosphate-selective porin OprO/OprP